MVERVRPQRFGLNQNYVFPNKEQSFWQSAPLSYQNKNAITKVIYQYNFDGIDDYASGSIPLFIGDVVEFELYLPSGISSTRILIGVTGSAAGLLSDSRVIVASSLNSAMIVDGVSLASGVDTYPSFDMVSNVKFNITSNTSLLTIMARDTLTNFSAGVAKNVSITRANPTSQYPHLYYPMNEGPGSTVMQQVLPTEDNWDWIYNNFNDERWERV